jgi:hypothetical protein
MPNDEQYNNGQYQEPQHRQKRKPNKWQLFLKECMPQQQDKSLSMTDKVSVCGVQYRELKEKNPKAIDDIANRILKKIEETKE